MAKKRKASAPAAPQGPNLDVGKSKRRIKDYQDVADSDDEFHDARDRILLDEGPEAKRRKQWDDQEAFLQQSDEEVLGYSESESEDDVHDAPQSMNRSSAVNANDASEGSAASADSDEEAENVVGWGTSRSDLYGADAIETEEQALEEEAEALRLQKKQLQNMTAADYGFDEDGWQQGKQHIVDEEENKNIVTEVLPPLHITPEMTTQDRLKLLNSRYPEFAPLSQELIRMKKLHAALAGPTNSIAPHEANRLTKLRAATAYLGTLAMYFALLASTAQIDPDSATAMPANVLHEHAIMDSLVQCRTLWQKASRLPEDRETIPEDLSADEDGSEEGSASIVDAPTTVAPPLSRAQRHAKAAHAQAEVERLERLKRTEFDLADLDALVAQASRNRAARPSTTAKGDDSDMGDEAPLTAREMAEKAKRKKSLRFYTSQIAQKANKRGASGRQAGGDEDIPHRERLRDRQARLNAEAEKRGRRDVGDDLGGDSDEDDARQAREIREEVDEDDYYDLVAARAARKKADKTALADAQQEAALRGGRVIEEETVGEDGKRKISYAIEKNKGLTPFRKKDVRNPRVKKRKKYDEKKKKLASMKPVYKGGEGRGGYGGELTGIKKGLVKSTRL